VATPLLQSDVVADIWFRVGSSWSMGGGVLQDIFEIQGPKDLGEGNNAVVWKACHRHTYVSTCVCVCVCVRVCVCACVRVCVFEVKRQVSGEHSVAWC